MITITIYGYEFRLQNNGDIQSRGNGLDWATRTAESLDIADGQLAWLQNMLQEAHSVFTNEQGRRPKVEPPTQERVDPTAAIGVDFVTDQDRHNQELLQKEAAQ